MTNPNQALIDRLLGGYSEASLKGMWNLLTRDMADWKGPIDTSWMTESAEVWDFIQFTIEFYTGAPVTREPIPSGCRFTCVGYRMGPAGP